MPFRSGLRKVEGWFVHLLHLDDTAHQIALGTGLGVFIAFTPTVGFQMLLVLLATSAVRANKVAGLPMPWITNPITILPIFSLNYVVGHALVGGPDLKGFETRLLELMSLDPGWVDWVKGWWHLMIDMAAPLWVGSVLCGLVAGAIAYAIMYYLITVYRRHHRRRLALAQAASAAGEGEGGEASEGPGDEAA
ncbi:MAG: DUF2062 domain-containing protein [Planctomycetota bacterium]|nr:DUF2062 domain-containing protein [Planctomycetota bacterium]